jgi:hypothetical protein
MRVIHFARTAGTGHVEPRCGDWGSMDTDWTDVTAGVTCVACRGALHRGPGIGVPAPEAFVVNAEYRDIREPR